MTPRRYTGYDGDAAGEHPALRALRLCVTSRYPNLVNLGTYVVRPMRGKTSPSVHGTGRAWDCGWTGDYSAVIVPVIRHLIRHAEQLDLDLVLDYHVAPHGRGWRCDRGTWQRYEQPTLAGAPNGKWIHVELAPTATVERVKSAFRSSVV